MLPASTPTKIASPPTKAMRTALRHATFVFRPLQYPSPSSATTEHTIESGNAWPTSNFRYGNSGMNPATKYATNMMAPAVIEPRISSTPPSISSTDASERKLPAAIENASTNIKTTPVKNIVPRGTPAMAMPERSPTVETSPSSTPNTKFRKKRALRRAVDFISPSYHPVTLPKKAMPSPSQYLGKCLSIGIFVCIGFFPGNFFIILDFLRQVASRVLLESLAGRHTYVYGHVCAW